MRRALIPLLILAALAGCASDHKLATCKGPLIVLNADRWHPTPEQMAAMSKACPEDS